MKYRAEDRTRLIPHTIDGITEMVPEDYTVHVPVPPHDWDRIILTAATAATAAILTASVVWSTSSVGALLGRSVESAIAYGAASVFDLVWIVCMAVEWLNRYNPRGAVLPRRAGHIALVIAMAAVCTNGWLTGGVAPGIIGAAVSALAKGTWTIVMKHTAKPLDPLTQGWVDRQMSEAGGRLALGSVRRQVARADGQYAAQIAALTPDGPDTDNGQPDTVSGTVRAAVRAALTTMPGAAPDEIVRQLAHAGIHTDEDTVRRLSGQQDSTSGKVLRLTATAGPSIADTIRTQVSAGVSDPVAVLAQVRTVHGSDVRADTVLRTLRRISRTA
ncbi:protein transporter Sec31 [Kitasatospora kifunensis]|uniref:Protein transporter Sec31 n=1 Tax=Kitasatospora kifunensis TaxID=58351 RepID=A0A7W7VU96_KITKI|nr:protein transporter Sec31 [Kitasatospora kifunensis]MBB4922245.1 hypothetical protein [Kitasatospora kifunensis]